MKSQHRNSMENCQQLLHISPSLPRMAPSHNRQRNFAVSTAPGGAVSQQMKEATNANPNRKVGSRGFPASKAPTMSPPSSLLITMHLKQENHEKIYQILIKKTYWPIAKTQLRHAYRFAQKTNVSYVYIYI